MAISTSLVLKFNGAAVKRGLAGMKASFSNLGSSIKKMGIGFTAFATASAVGLAALVVKLNAIGEAGISGDRALQNVAKQMRIFGNETDNVTKRLIDYADVTTRQMGLDGAAFGATQTKLLTFKELAKSADIAGGAFDRATIAAFDMASAGFGTAETNAVQLGKALNDPIKGINSLTRSGITFTAQEKKMIAAMVEGGEVMKAQNVILEAIETQVGGTAAATAMASGKITQSFNQIVDAFAEPFSTGFTKLPDALESVFPQIIAKAESMGMFVGDAISESISGNHEKFVELGMLIGEAIKGGIMIAFKIGLMEIGQASLGMFDSLQPAGARGGSFKPQADYVRENKEQYLRGEISDLVEGLSGRVSPITSYQSQGQAPPGYRFAKEDEGSMYSDANGAKIVKLLEDVNRNLQPTP
jgi:hypothetical protein